jgi:hypothetical protein
MTSQKGFNNNFEVNDENYDDLRLLASQTKLDSSNPPVATSYKGGSVLAFASNPNQKMYITAQLPHSWDGQDIEIHLHLALPVAGSGGGVENVKFDITHSWSSIGAQYPAESTITATLDVQDELVDAHVLMEIDDIAAGGNTFSSCIIMSLERDTGVANDYASSVYLVDVDMHYRKDKLGSATEEP